MELNRISGRSCTSTNLCCRSRLQHYARLQGSKNEQDDLPNPYLEIFNDLYFLLVTAWFDERIMIVHESDMTNLAKIERFRLAH